MKVYHFFLRNVYSLLLLSKHSKLLVTFQRHSHIVLGSDFEFLSLLSIVKSEEERRGRDTHVHCYS